VARIEDYYFNTDPPNDWLPAITRAQQLFLTPTDNATTPGFTLEFGPTEYSFSDTIQLVRSMHLVGAAGKIYSTLFKFPPSAGGIVCSFRHTFLAAAVPTINQTIIALVPPQAGPPIAVGDILEVGGAGGENMKVTQVLGGNQFKVVRYYHQTTPHVVPAYPGGMIVQLSGFRADCSIIERITLVGGGVKPASPGTPPPPPIYHGITMNVKVSLRDLAISSFWGDGIHIESLLSAPNAINWEVSNVQINFCQGDGLSVAGGAAGWGHADLLVCQSNNDYAIRDYSLGLGNAYVSCVAEGTKGFTNAGSPPPASVFINCDDETKEGSKIMAPAMVINGSITNVTNVAPNSFGPPTVSGGAAALGSNDDGAVFSSGVSAQSLVNPISTTRGRQVVVHLGNPAGELGAMGMTVLEGYIDAIGNFLSPPTVPEKPTTPTKVGTYDWLYGQGFPGWWGLHWGITPNSPLRISTQEATVSTLGPLSNDSQIWCQMGIFLGSNQTHIDAVDATELSRPGKPGLKAGDIAFNTNPQKVGDHVGWVWVVPPASAGMWMPFGKIDPPPP